MRKHDAINILNLYANSNHERWNQMLDYCYRTNNINKLQELHYAISVSMTDLAKQKINSSHMNDTFLRWLRSLEKTGLNIAKKINPNPLDTMSKQEIDILKNSDSIKYKKMYDAKKSRDFEVAEYFRKGAY